MAEVIPISETVRSARESVLSRLLEAHNSGDLESCVAAFGHPRLEVVPSGRVYDGAAELRAHFEERHHSFPDQRIDLISLHHSDDVVLAEYWMSGTHLGEFHGVEPGGKRFRVRMASVFEFRGADLIGQRAYFDMGTIARQLA